MEKDKKINFRINCGLIYDTIENKMEFVLDYRNGIELFHIPNSSDNCSELIRS